MNREVEQLRRKFLKKMGMCPKCVLAKTTLTSIAKKLKVSKSTLSRFQRGYEPDVNTFLKIQKWVSK